MDKEETSATFSSSFRDLWQLVKNEVAGFNELFIQKGQKTQRTINKNAKLKSSDLPPAFQPEIENYWEFLQALPWREFWMLTLMAFHLLCFIFIMLTRKYHNLQYVFFFLLLVAVYCSESINELAATHHKKFSKENYFDSQGLFLSTVFSGPILLNCLVLILMWLITTARQLINVKRQQYVASVKQQEKREERKVETKKDR